MLGILWVVYFIIKCTWPLSVISSLFFPSFEAPDGQKSRWGPEVARSPKCRWSEVQLTRSPDFQMARCSYICIYVNNNFLLNINGAWALRAPIQMAPLLACSHAEVQFCIKKDSQHPLLIAKSLSIWLVSMPSHIILLD